jgi:hypothetical protein
MLALHVPESWIVTADESDRSKQHSNADNCPQQCSNSAFSPSPLNWAVVIERLHCCHSTPSRCIGQDRISRLTCSRLSTSCRGRRMAQPFQEEVRAVVALLVDGRYDELARRTGGKRLTSEQMAAAVSGYGRRLIDLPSEAWDKLDAVRIKDAVPPAWSVRVDLWSAEEGRSDLTLELTVKQNGSSYDIEVEDLHVL